MMMIGVPIFPSLLSGSEGKPTWFLVFWIICALIWAGILVWGSFDLLRKK